MTSVTRSLRLASAPTIMRNRFLVDVLPTDSVRSETIAEHLSQGVKDAQAKFDAGMGADGDASPYPMLRELRATAPVHPGWREMGILDNPEEGQQIFTAYSFDAVKAVFTDNKTFSTRCYEAIVRPLQGPTILEMQEPEHQVYRRLHEFAFARSSMRRWEAELVRPLVEGTVDRLADTKRADLVEEVFMPIPVRVIAALIGLPESDIGEFHRPGNRSAGFPLRYGHRDAGFRTVEGVLRRHPRRPQARTPRRHGQRARRR